MKNESSQVPSRKYFLSTTTQGLKGLHNPQGWANIEEIVFYKPEFADQTKSSVYLIDFWNMCSGDAQRHNIG